MAAPPTLASISRRLTSTSQLLLERTRVISLQLNPSAASTNTILRNLTAIKGDLEKIEGELNSNGLAGSGSGTAAGKGKESEVERQIREVGESYDRLVGMLSEDEAGRAKAAALVRVKREATPPPPSPSPEQDPFSDPPTQGAGAIPSISFEPPTPSIESSAGAGAGRSKANSKSASAGVRPFRDDPDEVEENMLGFGGNSNTNPSPDEGDLLSQQQLMMDDQDERLNFLSNSINRQNHLSIQIGDELDVHHQLLEDTDSAMDRTAARLGRARKRLDKVASDAKQYGSTLTIVGLIFILLILIIVFKT